MASGASDASSTSPQSFTSLTLVGVGYRTCLSPWPDFIIKLVRRAGFEPAMYLTCRIYSPVPSNPLGSSAHLAEAVGFEPTEDFSSTALKAVAISQTLPHFRKRELYSVRAFACAPRIGSRLIPCIAICVIQTTPRGGCYYHSPYFYIN